MGRLKLLNVLRESNGVTRYVHEVFDEELTEEYPTNFDINQFKVIRSYAGKLKYASQFLGKPIGSGSSRTVYRVDQNKVLKLAKNQKGIEQNQAETNWNNDSYYGGILAKIFDFDDETNLWVEMEIAFKPKKSDFKRLWNINFDDLFYYLNKYHEENRGRKSYFRIDDNVKNMMDENDDVQTLLSFMMDSDSPPGDLSRISSWGLVHRQDGDYLVLVDFGLSNDIYNNFYKR